MTLHLENEYEGNDFEILFPFDVQKLAEEVCEAVLDLENCPYEAEAELLLTDDEGIHEANLSNRGIDRVTDVLSFPSCEYREPAGFSQVEEDEWLYFNPDTGCLMLGDIMISVPKCAAQAKEYGHSVKREFAFLVAHSTLHLIGYDHMTEEEEKIMFAKQEQVLQSLHISREDQ